MYEAVTKKQITILNAFGLDVEYVRLKATEIGRLIADGASMMDVANEEGVRRKKTVASIDFEIVRTQDALVKAQVRYDAIARNLEEIMEKKREHQARAIMDAFIKSSNSYKEIMHFLNIDGR